MDQFKNKLSSHLNKFPTSPYLFIGSGVSRRYINLPTWLDLLQGFHAISQNKTPFEYYESKCDKDAPKLASLLADEFHETWWKENDFEESRRKYKSEAKSGKQMPLKIELCNYLKRYSSLNESIQKEVKLLSSAVIDGIITTNWDTFLEETFPDYKVFIGQQELLFSESFSVGEIFKIHGSIEKASSLVVTSEDYQNFNSRYAYLAAKLLTIFVEHPVIFLGYSLSDRNILEILSSIVSCVDNNNVEKLQDRLIFVIWDESTLNPTFTASQIVLEHGKILPIQLIKLNTFIPLYEVLNSLKKRLPVRLLRQLKDSVVEFVKTTTPTANVFVGDLDELANKGNIEFAIGIGIANKMISQQGYKGINGFDLIEDVIYENKNYDANLLIENTLPELLKGNAYYPICKYLRKEGHLLKNGNLSSAGALFLKNKFKFRQDMPDCFLPTKQYLKKKEDIRKNYKDISAVLDKQDNYHALIYIPLLDKKVIEINELQAFLKKCYNDKSVNRSTAFKKLVCYYDYLKYANIQ